jgi:lipopolysaccharide transport system permease protein
MLFRYGTLVRAMTMTRLKIRYRQSVLGWSWAILHPLVLMVLYAAIFAHAMGYGTAPIPYPLFVMAGILPWSFCATAISTSASGMLSHHALMAKVHFPREIVLLSYVAAASVDFLIALVMLLCIMPLYGLPLTPETLFAVPIFAILVLHTTGLCLLLSAAQIGVRDITIALPLVLQVLMFTSPIVYPASIVPASFQTLFWLNPLATLVSDFRQAVLAGETPAIAGILISAFSGMIVFLLGYAVFKRLETKMIDEL